MPIYGTRATPAMIPHPRVPAARLPKPSTTDGTNHVHKILIANISLFRMLIGLSKDRTCSGTMQIPLAYMLRSHAGSHAHESQARSGTMQAACCAASTYLDEPRQARAA